MSYLHPAKSFSPQKLDEALNKVPEVTLSFWIVKLLSTTVGETGADYLAVNIGLGAGVTTAIMAALLAISLFAQLRSKRYVPALYWLAVVLVSIVGTQITDILTDHLEVSLTLSTAVFTVLLIATFSIWYGSEKTLSMKSITNTRRELFYWLAILLTFALGTAAGDLATEAIGLGFKLGCVVFSAMIAVIGIAYWFGLNSVTTFWLTYILTRPLGASFGDLLSQSREYGGLGFGSIWTSAIFLSIIVGFVAYLNVQQNPEMRLGSVDDRIN